MKLSIVAISLNEAEHLPTWYNRHKELGDEIILVDTESWDETQTIAKGLPGLKFYEIKWHDSFAEAKNFGLRACRGDWILLHSPDFLINKEDFKLIRETIETTDKVGFFLPTLHHFVDWTGEKDLSVKITEENKLQQGIFCLFKNCPEIYYTGRVHEQAHEQAINAFGKEKIGVLPVIRHHDNTCRAVSTRKKLKYYDWLENISAVERKFWEHGALLRKGAYDDELIALKNKNENGG